MACSQLLLCKLILLTRLPLILWVNSRTQLLRCSVSKQLQRKYGFGRACALVWKIHTNLAATQQIHPRVRMNAQILRIQWSLSNFKVNGVCRSSLKINKLRFRYSFTPYNGTNKVMFRDGCFNQSLNVSNSWESGLNWDVQYSKVTDDCWALVLAGGWITKYDNQV